MDYTENYRIMDCYYKRAFEGNDVIISQCLVGWLVEK